MRAFPADSLEYFGETALGNTALPVVAAEGEREVGWAVLEVALGAGVAAVPLRQDARNVFRSAPFKPCVFASALHSFIRSRWPVWASAGEASARINGTVRASGRMAKLQARAPVCNERRFGRFH